MRPLGGGPSIRKPLSLPGPSHRSQRGECTVIRRKVFGESGSGCPCGGGRDSGGSAATGSVGDVRSSSSVQSSVPLFLAADDDEELTHVTDAPRGRRAGAVAIATAGATTTKIAEYLFAGHRASAALRPVTGAWEPQRFPDAWPSADGADDGDDANEDVSDDLCTGRNEWYPV